MMKVFNIFRKKSAETAAAVKRIEKKDLLEATLAGAILVLHADGEASDTEFDTLIAIAENNPCLAHFGSEIGLAIERYRSMYKSGATSASIKLMREIRDCKHSKEEAEDIVGTIIDVANADGNICEAEKEIIKKICRELGENPKEYGLE